jgi:hypothetical protein
MIDYTCFDRVTFAESLHKKGEEKKKAKRKKKKERKYQPQITIASHDADASVHSNTREERETMMLPINLRLPDRRSSIREQSIETHA